MPRESVWMLRAALVHLLIGSALGAMLLVAKDGIPVPAGGAWLGLHRDTVLVGWMVQTVLGVAYWILPKHPREPIRGRRWPILAGIALLNGGVGAASIGRVAGVPAAGPAALCGAAALFAMMLLPRVKAFGAGRPGTR